MAWLGSPVCPFFLLRLLRTHTAYCEHEVTLTDLPLYLRYIPRIASPALLRPDLHHPKGCIPYHVFPPRARQIHFMGWSTKWDQLFERTSQDLQELHTFTTHWRQVAWPYAAKPTVAVVAVGVVVSVRLWWWCC